MHRFRRLSPLPWRRAGLALAAIAALGLAPALGAEARPRQSPAEHVARHAEQLDLDAATQERLAAIVSEAEAQEQALRAEMRAARKEMRTLLSAPEIDRAAVMAQADVFDALHAREHRQRLDTILRIHDLLSPEQRAALVAIRERERPWKRGRGPLGRCSSDLRTLCADAPEGPDALRCLADRWDEASESCREAVARCRHDGDAPGDAAIPDAR